MAEQDIVERLRNGKPEVYQAIQELRKWADWYVSCACGNVPDEAAAAYLLIEEFGRIDAALTEERSSYIMAHGVFQTEALRSKNEIDRLTTENATLRQQLADAREDGSLFDALAANSWDLRCISVPIGGDDHDIDWVIIEHHQAEPHERTIAQAYKDDPRAAMRRAMRASDPNAERCVSCDEVLHDGDSVYHEHGEGGHIHSWCVDDPDSFVDEDGETAPSKPTPFAYSALSDREGERNG